MAADTLDPRDIKNQLDKFLHGIDAIMLATVNEEGLPEASYTPFVEYDGCFYIFVSELASHTQNLKQFGVGNVMFMENEADVGHAFARKRLTCHCEATVIQRNEALFGAVMALMKKRFGKLITTLQGLNDFHLLQLEPQTGNFVAGFGKAYEVDYSQERAIRHKRAD